MLRLYISLIHEEASLKKSADESSFSRRDEMMGLSSKHLEAKNSKGGAETDTPQVKTDSTYNPPKTVSS